jgi:hypothetical protein
MRTSLVLSLALALAACSRDKPAPVAEASGSARSASPAAPAGVEIFVNDTSVGSIAPAQIAGWPRLDTLVPADARKLGTWELVSVQGPRAKPSELSHPSTSYPDMVPALFPGDGGAPAFGMFDAVELARKGKAALREDHVTAIRIKVAQGGGRGQNDDGGGGGGDPTKLVITVKTPSGTTSLTGEKLLSLPREPTPGSPDQKGWRLQALLDAAGVTTYSRLVLTDASGANLILDRKDLSDTSVPFIKLNKQGVLRLRVLKKAGDGWNPAGDLRGLVAIEAK